MKKREKVCSGCKATKPIKQFSTTPQTADGYSGRCKLCTTEQVKRGYRKTKKLPAFLAEVKTWPLVKLHSEILWLESKLAALRREFKERNTG